MMKKALIIILLIVITIIVFITTHSSKPHIGGRFTFGKREWRVLDIKDGKALIITQNIIEKRPYHQNKDDITWEKSSLREYLNNEYYNTKFTPEEKACIIETRNTNPPDPWSTTKGGVETIDKIFLLNLDEVIKYLGVTGDISNLKRLDTDQMSIDEYIYIEDYSGIIPYDRLDNARQAKAVGRNEQWWWLRTPGFYSGIVAGYNLRHGYRMYGHKMNISESGGVRPAMWVKI